MAKFEPKTYTVKFTDGETVNESKVTHGKTVTKPEDPVKEGYQFVGWFDGEKAFSFDEPIISDISLAAKFVPEKVTVQIWDEEGKNLIKSETVHYGRFFHLPIIDKTGYRGVYESDDASYDMGSVIHPKQDISFRLRFIERVRIKYYVDDTGPTDLDKGPNYFGGHEAFVDKGSPISSIPKFAYVSTRYPLIRYDRENGRFDPEPFDLNTPITEPIDLVSISKGIHGGAIFLYVEPGGNPERLYHKIWVDRIEKIPEINLRAGGYHNDGWREADKAERYEFEGNFGNARGKVFVPYWVKDE